MTNITRRLRQRDARLSRFSKNNPAAAAAVVNALDRVRHFRGEASEHMCTTCAETAAEWQLIELSRREGPWFLLYSDEAAHYSPFCSPCALDAEDRREAQLDEIWGH
ncbi:hypothetical protein PV367_29790 [Streptomyces europaeiscabiei]|uniref:Uncharacterized protein n=1 Tax=Streptomyces europaeiscabiei TaxID=146819 RepID=A0AAJ2PUN6_9ACTN|nr:hypothetical protein [Streptomyces europaeiscabiei]MDX3133882.1 hypothetical protein [Streptomyces europaeiscabiei]